MWGQLENKGKEQKLAIIHSVGWDERKKTRQIGVEKLVPRIFFKHCGPLLFAALQWYSPPVHPILPSFRSEPTFSPKVPLWSRTITTAHHLNPHSRLQHPTVGKIQHLLPEARSETLTWVNLRTGASAPSIPSKPTARISPVATGDNWITQRLYDVDIRCYYGLVVGIFWDRWAYFWVFIMPSNDMAQVAN